MCLMEKEHIKSLEPIRFIGHRTGTLFFLISVVVFRWHPWISLDVSKNIFLNELLPQKIDGYQKNKHMFVKGVSPIELPTIQIQHHMFGKFGFVGKISLRVRPKPEFTPSVLRNGQFASNGLQCLKMFGNGATMADIQSKEDFRAARLTLGLSTLTTAKILNVTERNVQYWEDSGRRDRQPNKTACRVMEWLIEGFRPPQFRQRTKFGRKSLERTVSL